MTSAIRSLDLGLALKRIASDETKRMLQDASEAVSQAVRWVINLAPFGIMGLVYSTVSTNGLEIFTKYGRLLALLVGCMLAVALVVDPLIAFVVLGLMLITVAIVKPFKESLRRFFYM